MSRWYTLTCLDVGVVSTARFLIRLIGLIPDAIDVEQSARDLDALVADLHKCQSLSIYPKLS
jgi:hypothetical protein